MISSIKRLFDNITNGFVLIIKMITLILYSIRFVCKIVFDLFVYQFFKFRYKGKVVKHLYEDNLYGKVKDVEVTSDGIFLVCSGGALKYEPYDVVEISQHLWKVVHQRKIPITDEKGRIIDWGIEIREECKRTSRVRAYVEYGRRWIARDPRLTL